MDAFVSACVAQFGANAASALRLGCAPDSELERRVRGEYELSVVQGEFEFTVAEMVTGVFARDDPEFLDDAALQRAITTPIAAADFLDMCVVEVERALARRVVDTVVAAMLARGTGGALAALPDVLLVRIAETARAGLRRAQKDYARRRADAARDIERAFLSAWIAAE